MWNTICIPSGHRLKALAEDAIQNGYIAPGERKSILEKFEEGLRGYTYFEK